MNAPTNEMRSRAALLRRERARSRERGFTLTELTVSLIGGLLVAMAVVGLSREANNTFHEEMRTASAESDLRTALDRLRADLQRASFMGTGNVTRDPNIAVAPGNPHVGTTARAKYPKLASLAGIQLNVGGSLAQTPLSASQTPALNPDSIDIAGNLASTDAFVILSISQTSPGPCGGQRIWLQTDTPAMWRILATQSGPDGGAPNAANQALANAFQPIPNEPMIVRVQDRKGMYQYVVTCATGTGGASDAVPSPWIDIDQATPILTSKDTGGFGGIDGLCSGCMVNPVQVVRWEIRPTNFAALNPKGDPTMYNLVRSYVHLADATTIAASTEVIAEYAVDLKFALTVDTSTDTSGATPLLTTIAFDNDTENVKYAPDVSTMPQFGSGYIPGGPEPQRIRAVRTRLVTRSSIADRNTNVPVPALGAQRFLYRYCAGAPGDGGAPPDCTQQAPIWARARTITTETWLTNQAGMFYQ